MLNTWGILIARWTTIVIVHNHDYNELYEPLKGRKILLKQIIKDYFDPKNERSGKGGVKIWVPNIKWKYTCLEIDCDKQRWR